MENSSLGGLKFGVDSDGNYGYIKAGADTVIPFKSSTNCTVTLNMPWHSSYSMYGTITVTIKIVNGIVTSVTSPGRIQIASDGNWIEMINNSANLIDN